ncbi:MAG: glycine dehydrogenase (aminomethyl-transferring) [Candidatus Schekmanbacteria bacterium RIFCSPLOWO2_02_FULL_38_14]|uniref:Probable glycine dehydrogenase (decarboxylating) subunit 2 n=1 Tax=Candidatus Schekmanbacteria bacterium RIFCSPLOWO2_12_FULL_38_15 TaxID=1817883 RepID=A0A1F7SH03_9BACT|nr:MAG: glycine dehydrogenase (aminomethyl-transferring) [Candidatus Schekmanbacteria bacterium RIFCSPLOWO2_02_FULL_38_14]OGL52514.1 MAG: glycine dehydrogenase (aminomethyl-transferring) [Candidatus Schekmanbacteria bacterium RIFCSPLOWO2_12_FULL_38_15]
MYDKLIFEVSSEGREGYSLPELDVPVVQPERVVPDRLVRREDTNLPEVSEPEIVRHFVNLSKKNYSIDEGFYPLGSCTMKYNPKINEEAASSSGFSNLHPNTPEKFCQGALKLMYELEGMLCEIGGVSRVTLQPAAGAHGELCGTLIIRAYFLDRNEKKDEVIIPDSAHGTNPASAALAGMKVRTVKSNSKGEVDLDDLSKIVSDKTAALILTNPNTLGIFESQILKISEIIHSKGGLLYLDGANLNAFLGLARPGDMGFDLVHFNLHKSFSTPHGCGGPGAGPLGVKEHLKYFLPLPTVEKKNDSYYFNWEGKKSIGRIHGFYGNFGVLVRAYAYIKTMGPSGLKEVGRTSILNANYLMKKLKEYYDLPFDRPCMHEFVLSARRQKKKGVKALDIAKRIMDYGFHPPTIYFPLIVDEALMIEVTETEDIDTLDRFASALISIAGEVEENPDIVKRAPESLNISRLDEVMAVKKLDIRYKKI